MIYHIWPEHIRNRNKDMKENEFIFSIRMGGEIYAMAGRIDSAEDVRQIGNSLRIQIFDRIGKGLEPQGEEEIKC